jgi:CDP-paratose 2-epimerase
MILVTGTGGLIGNSVSNFFLKKKFNVIGIDNNQRKKFFGKNGNIEKNIIQLKKNKKFQHKFVDILDKIKLENIFKKNKFSLIIHAAAQPSHDWSATNPNLDFHTNAVGTLNILECVRKYSSNSIVIYLSTNKVYGDLVNSFEYKELKTRYEIKNKYKDGFDENINIDNSKHSPFGVSKLSGDLLVQEYGKYFGIRTCCLRAGCLTGETHAGVELHGFLSYLFKSAYYKKKYFIYGYKGKQVRDNLSSYDVSTIIWELYNKPSMPGEIFNIGGGRESNISVLEAIDKCEAITKNKFNFEYVNVERSGDHKFWITNMKKFKKKYPKWKIKYSIDDIFLQMLDYENFRTFRK